MKAGWRAIAVAALTAMAPAQAASAFETGFADPLYLKPANHWLEKTRSANSRIVRLNVVWRSVVGGSPPAHPGNPGDPAYNFANLDASVKAAKSHGLQVLLTTYSAPDWAEGKGRPGGVPAGTWKPEPGAFGSFAHALAARYSGHFEGLPRVKDFEAWNEPNLSAYLNPQYEGKQQKSADHYRALLNAFYRGVHGVHTSNNVLNGGLAPYGDPPGGSRTRPLTFMRRLLCLNNNLRPARCHSKARLDIFADHPINTSGGPNRSAVNPNDAATPDFKHVTRTLRAAERYHLLEPGGRRPLWATEIWWDSNPPDHVEGVPVKTQAHWLEEALHILWKQGASVVINLQIRDSKFDPNNAVDSTSTGVFFQSGKPKPSYTAWRFPFVVTSRSAHAAKVWGRSPGTGRLKVQAKRHGGWHTVTSLRAHRGRIFRSRVHVPRGRALRARVGKATSLAAH